MKGTFSLSKYPLFQDTDGTKISAQRKLLKGFTMLELVLVIVIVAIIATALLSSLVACLALNENSRMMTMAMNIARDKIEDLVNKRSNWGSIVSASYGIDVLSNEPTDTPPGYSFNGSCNVTVSEVITGSLKFVRVVVCWRLKDGRIVGTDNGPADQCLNGVLDGGEGSVVWDVGTNQHIPVLNSPVVIITAISSGS